jgi:hypothetical protein
VLDEGVFCNYIDLSQIPDQDDFDEESDLKDLEASVAKQQVKVSRLNKNIKD